MVLDSTGDLFSKRRPREETCDSFVLKRKPAMTEVEFVISVQFDFALGLNRTVNFQIQLMQSITKFNSAKEPCDCEL